MAVPLLSQGRHGAQSKLVEYLDPAFFLQACFTEEYTSITGETLYNIGCQSLTVRKNNI